MSIDKPTKPKGEYPYPIHQWNDKNKYKKNLTRSEWAWEFLRRNGDYQHDCDRYHNDDEFKEYRIENRVTGKVILSYNDVYSQEDQDKNTELMNAQNFKIFLLEKYEIRSHYLYKPRLDQLIRGFGISHKDGHVSFSQYNDERANQRPLAPDNNNELVIKLYLGRPLKEQMLATEKLFENLSKKIKSDIKRRSSSNADFIKYIRVLDAVASGKDPLSDAKDIAFEIVPYKFENPNYRPDTDVKQWLSKGMEFINYKYLELLSSPM